MNERIRELAERAEFSEKDLHVQGDNFQKFAELIVRECSEIVMDCDVTKYSDFRQGIAQEITQHFGVEEK